MPPPERYVVLRSFLSRQEQEDLKEEAIQCHRQKSSDPTFQAVHTTASIPLNLGITCGSSVESQLPLASQLARRAFAHASCHAFPEEPLLRLLSSSSSSSSQHCSLTGLALLYGPNAKMSPHFDSPTQPGQRHEWLVMMTVGKAVAFVCNDKIITLSSGDVLVMDAMAVLHGVQSILPDDCDIELPLQGSRLGVLLWQARQVDPVERSTRGQDDTVDGMHMLYYHDDDSSDDDVDAD